MTAERKEALKDILILLAAVAIVLFCKVTGI